MEKRGQAMPVQTIVLIILILIVLVVLVLHFTIGLQNLWGRITGVYKIYSKEDIQIAKARCEGFTSTDDFCTAKIPIYNSKNKTDDYFYCYEAPINAKIVVEGKTIDKNYCQANYPPSPGE